MNQTNVNIYPPKKDGRNWTAEAKRDGEKKREVGGGGGPLREEPLRGGLQCLGT